MDKITSKKIDYKYIESLVGKVIKKLNAIVSKRTQESVRT